jgi:hypothetical protein
LPGTVSRKAIDHVKKQRSKLVAAMKKHPGVGQLDLLLPVCTGEFTAQFGLPCAHPLFTKLSTNEALDRYSLDFHWHLGSEPTVQDAYAHLVDPAVIIRGRGRPANPPEPDQRPAFQALRQEARDRAAQAAESPRRAQEARQQQANTQPVGQQNELGVEDIWGVVPQGRPPSNVRRQRGARARIPSHDEEPRSQLPASLRAAPRRPRRGGGGGGQGQGSGAGQGQGGGQTITGWRQWQPPNAAP